MDYLSKRWARLRSRILRRDGYVDKVMEMYGTKIDADTVHHIFPADEFPHYSYCDWNLVSVSGHTHRTMLHEKYSGKLTKLGRNMMLALAAQRGIKIRMKILICGMPGTGKSVLARKLIEHNGGLCYDLDAIAAAFRLTVPHREQDHAGARRMAAALRPAWILEAQKHTDTVVVIRAAPDIDEVMELDPDKIYICRHRFADRSVADSEKVKAAIEIIEAWAAVNHIDVTYNPG